MRVKFTLFPNHSFRAAPELCPWATLPFGWGTGPQSQKAAPYFFLKELPASPLPHPEYAALKAQGVLIPSLSHRCPSISPTCCLLCVQKLVLERSAHSCWSGTLSLTLLKGPALLQLRF